MAEELKSAEEKKGGPEVIVIPKKQKAAKSTEIEDQEEIHPEQ
jgi:hypothetical protein